MYLTIAIIALALYCASMAYTAFSLKIIPQPGQSACETASDKSQEQGGFRHGLNHAITAALLLVSAFLPAPYTLYGAGGSVALFLVVFALLYFGILWKPVSCIDGTVNTH